jgi:Protein of unknown function (DUF3467)
VTTVATWGGLSGGDEPPRYSNAVNIATSQWDISIDFQLNTQASGSTPENLQVERRPVGRIVMSPMHAKALAHLLDDAVGRWEATYGELPSVAQLLRTAAPNAGSAGSDLSAPESDQSGSNGDAN